MSRAAKLVLALAACLAPLGWLASSCTFPDIEYGPAPAAGGGSTTGTGGSTTGAGGAPATTTTTSTGAGGAPGCDADSDGVPAVSCDGGTDCDDDGDDADSTACDGGTDCDDTDDRVHPGQTQYFEAPSHHAGFDYDCNGAEEEEISFYKCSGLLCDTKENVFLLQDTACGEAGVFGDCNGLCDVTIDDSNKVRRCR